jgi:hypothetical protein
MANPAPELTGPIAVAVDRSQDRKTWSICAAQRTVEGIEIHLECAPYQHLSSTADVVDKLVDIVCAWDPVSVTIDQRSAAAVIEPTLKAVEVEPHMANSTEMTLAAGSFLDAVEAGTLSHSSQPPLTDGAVSATKRPLGAGFAWSEAPPRRDVPERGLIGVLGAVVGHPARAAEVATAALGHQQRRPPRAGVFGPRLGALLG